MRDHLDALTKLQQIDLQTQKLTNRFDELAVLEKNLTEMSRLDQAAVDTAQAALSQQQNEIRSLYQQWEQETVKARKWEARLHEIRNTREYQALLRETEGLKRANRELEDKINTAQKQSEVLQAQLLEQQNVLATRHEESIASKQQWEAQRQENLAAQAALAEQRKLVSKQIPARLLNIYDTIRQRRLGSGLAAVEGGCCTGCHIRLSPQLAIELQRGENILQCPSCRRIIYWQHKATAQHA